MTDVTLVSAIKNADISKMKVYDAFTPNPTTVRPDTQVDEVCRLMAAEKIGSVVVEDNGHLVGLAAMDELLHTRLK